MNLALTSEACFKGLPKNTNGEVIAFKGWPKLNWFITEHLPKPPKDWMPPPRLTDDTPAYVEVRFLSLDLNCFRSINYLLSTFYRFG